MKKKENATQSVHSYKKIIQSLATLQIAVPICLCLQKSVCVLLQKEVKLRVLPQQWRRFHIYWVDVKHQMCYIVQGYRYAAFQYILGVRAMEPLWFQTFSQEINCIFTSQYRTTEYTLNHHLAGKNYLEQLSCHLLSSFSSFQ